MKTTCVVVAYNYLELFQKCIESVIEMSSSDVEIIVVDNHSPDERTRQYIQKLPRSILVVDPGKNIGCHAGFSLGFKHATGDYLVKLDDDSVILTKNWDVKMIKTLRTYSDVAFIAPHSNVEQGGRTVSYKNFDHKDNGVIGFSMMMIPRSNYELFGGNLGSSSKDYTGVDTSLYGGEELFMAKQAINHGMRFGYSPHVSIYHADNEQRPICYVLWKEYYGYHGKTDKDYSDFIQDEEQVTAAFRIWENDPNNQWKADRAREYLNKEESSYFFK